MSGCCCFGHAPFGRTVAHMMNIWKTKSIQLLTSSSQRRRLSVESVGTPGQCCWVMDMACGLFRSSSATGDQSKPPDLAEHCTHTHSHTHPHTLDKPKESHSDEIKQVHLRCYAEHPQPDFVPLLSKLDVLSVQSIISWIGLVAIYDDDYWGYEKLLLLKYRDWCVKNVCKF